MKDTQFDAHKALIIPVTQDSKIFIQDRHGHKKPDWGYFGGSIEEGESPVQAVIRETKEELSIDIQESDLINLGTSVTDWDGYKIIRYLFLYPTDQKEFDVKEGRGGLWLTFEEATDRMDDADRFKEVSERIRVALKK
jgi:8-oxo-dGTP diphosphatase